MVGVVDLTDIEQVKIIPNSGRMLVIANINHREASMIQGFDKVGKLVVNQYANNTTPIWAIGLSPQAKRFFTDWIREELTRDTEEGKGDYTNG